MQTSKTSYKIIYTIIINAFRTHIIHTKNTHTKTHSFIQVNKTHINDDKITSEVNLTPKQHMELNCEQECIKPTFHPRALFHLIHIQHHLHLCSHRIPETGSRST